MRNINKMLMAAGVGVITLLSAACSDDLTPGGYENLGQKKEGTLTVPFGSTSPVTVTRAVDFSQDAMVKIDSYWVGIFDTVTGELLGSVQDNSPRKENGTRNTLYNNSTPFTVNDVNIWYYENHPEVYVVGVINYMNVKAKANPKETSTVNLEELLPKINSFEEFTKISIDTQSADVANRSHGSDESCPLMMGFYRTGTSTTHATVTAEGSVTQDDTKVRITDGSSGKKLADGAIKLQRLLAEMNFIVSPGSNVTIRSLEYMVVNNPQDVYLVEHATDEQGGTTNDEKTYMNRTPNSADITGNFISSSYYMPVNQQPGGSYNFTYQAYENKHWGRKWNFPSYTDEDGNTIEYDQNDILVREKRYDDPNAKNGKSDVFRTLCQYQESPYNNSASYVILKATISFKDSQKMVFVNENYESLGYGFEQTSASDAVIYYTIHEGATSRPDGSVNNGSSRGYDYQRIRNTQYQYWIQINGLDDIIVQAKQEDGIHNDAISGEVWNTDIFEFDYGNPYQYRALTVTFNNKEELEAMTWRVYYKSPEGEENYGDWEKNPSAPAYYPEWPYLSESKLTNANELPEPHKSDVNIVDVVNQSVKIPITDFKSKSSGFSYPVTFIVSLDPIADFDYNNQDQYRRGFYMSLNDERQDGDGCEIHQRVFGFEQGVFDGRETLSPSGTYPFFLVNHDNQLGAGYHWTYEQSIDNASMACGAPGTATWLGVEIRDGNIGREDLVGFKVRIGRENGYTTVLKMEDAEGPFFNNVGNHQNYYFPLSIPEVNSAFGNNGTFKGNYSTNYGYFMVELQPIPNPEKYRPWDSDEWYEIRSGFLLTQRAYSGENRPQWIFADLGVTEPGYNEFWTYYSNSSNYRESREYGGLTIWSKSDKDINSLRGINNNEDQGYLDKEHDCIKFGGGGNFGSSYSDTDNQLVLSFWVNRPGKIKLSYGFNSRNSGNCYWAAKVRGTNSIMRWEMTDQNMGYLTMNAEGTGSLDFPSGPEKVNSDGTFKTPVEIGIYPVGGAAFIYSIEFIPE